MQVALTDWFPWWTCEVLRLPQWPFDIARKFSANHMQWSHLAMKRCTVQREVRFKYALCGVVVINVVGLNPPRHTKVECLCHECLDKIICLMITYWILSILWKLALHFKLSAQTVFVNCAHLHTGADGVGVTSLIYLPGSERMTVNQSRVTQ